MNPQPFLNTIYLGDRACKAIYIDAWNKVAKIQIDSISRVRGETWDYYTNEDIVDGWLVFLGVESFTMSPPGKIPNDYVLNYSYAGWHPETQAGRFLLEIAQVDSSGSCAVTFSSG
jgi:hypothetical protein